MNPCIARRGSARRVLAASLAIVASSFASTGSIATTLGNSSGYGVTLAQSTAQETTRQPGMPANLPSGSPSWTFGSLQSDSGSGWTVERGTMTSGNGEAVLQPTNDRRVVLLSPPGLPDAARNAEGFVLGVSGTGLQRVRIQARRDARGGWITIADASGAALRKVADGYAINRNSSARGTPIERLRIEFTFRTTNPRSLTRISVGATSP